MQTWPATFVFPVCSKISLMADLLHSPITPPSHRKTKLKLLLVTSKKKSENL